jgi:hypothetical protein
MQENACQAPRWSHPAIRPDGPFRLRLVKRCLGAMIAHGRELVKASIRLCGGRYRSASTDHVIVGRPPALEKQGSRTVRRARVASRQVNVDRDSPIDEKPQGKTLGLWSKMGHP